MALAWLSPLKLNDLVETRRNNERRFIPRVEVLEERETPSAARYVPDSSAFAWMTHARESLQQEFAEQTLTSERFAGEWVVNLAPGLDAAQSAAAWGMTFVSSQTHLIDNTYIFRFDLDQATPVMADVNLTLQENQGQLHWFYPLLSTQQSTRLIPNDPQFGNQWHLLNTGQGGGTVGIDANVTGVWDTYLGRGVVIGIVDDGLQWDHPDLVQNAWTNPDETVNGQDDDGNGLIDDIRGWNFNGNNNDPRPNSTHGTPVGGVAAARGNNGIGVSGAAPEAQLVGLRLIAGPSNDAMEAAALSYKSEYVGIYSNSWGPSDNGSVIAGPGPLTRAAMQNVYTNGRNGLGSIFTWAGGNGGNNDNANFDGYANSRFAIGVAAVNNFGVRSSYSEAGANIMVAAPSNGGSLGITTTAFNNGYTNSFGGTSSATPLVSGVIALIMEANPNLTARDIQHILARSSRQVDASNPDWVINGAGLHHSHFYGFGMIDAAAAVALAESWTNVGQQVSFGTGVVNVNEAIPDGLAEDVGGGAVIRTFEITEDLALEHVEIVVNVTHGWRGDLKFTLTSPDGTRSDLGRRKFDSNANLNDWKLMSVRHWGESTAGTWTLEVEDFWDLFEGTWNSFEVIFHALDPNIAPVALPDNYEIDEDNVLIVSAAQGVLANDFDPDNTAPLTAQLLTTTVNGVLVFNLDGSFTYTPNANYHGVDTFTYRAFDSKAFSNPVQVTIVVNPVNDPPVAQDDGPYFVEGGTVFTLGGQGVLANDSDIDGDPLQAILFSGPSKGDLVLNTNGTFTYTPFAGATGADSFQYRAFDGEAFSNVATVSFTINNRPVALPDSYATLWNQPLFVSSPGVLDNDFDLDSDLITAELVTTTAHGSLIFVANGSFSYTPNSFFHGVDSFTYRVRDPFFVGNTVTVTITVQPAPLAGDDFYSATGGQWLHIPAPGVLANDVNLGGGQLFAELVGAGPLFGELQFHTNGSFSYLPVNNFNGVDTFTYRAHTAGGIYSNLATVHLNVTAPLNQPPTANPESYSTSQGTPLSILPLGILANDTDPEGDPLTAHLVSGTSHGLLGLQQNGGFTYTPNPGFTGIDSFTYRAHDGTSFSNVATVTIQVNPGVAPPSASNDAYSVVRDQTLFINAPGLLANDTDPQGLPLTAQLWTGPAAGTVFLSPNGSFTYTPNPGFTGGDSFTYRAFNGFQFSNVATVAINVLPPAQPPTAHPDQFHTQKDQPLVVAGPGVLANDFDPQGLPLTAQLVSAASHGTLLLQSNGGFSYLPALGFVGTDSFTYRASNGVAAPSAPTTVTITVTPGAGHPFQRVIVAPEAGMAPWIKIYDGATQTEVHSFLAYEIGFTGGVRVATADLNGDGIPEIITAPGAGRAPHVRVFDGATYLPLPGARGQFLAYASNFTGGVFVAVGDVNGDGVADIITGPGAGASPNVRVFNGLTGVRFSGTVGSFNAYPTSFKGGVRVAAADLNGDGRADVITAPGAGTGNGVTGLVKTFDLTRRVGSNPFVMQQFTPYGNFAGGVFVVAGDLDGDGRAEIVTSPGAGIVGEVKIFAPNSTVPVRSFTPLPGYTGGLRVGVADVDGNGRNDLFVASAGGIAAKVRFYDALTLQAMFGGAALEPFAGFFGGLNLAGKA